MRILTVNAIIPTRLDRCLKRLYPNLTQGKIEQALRKGKIKVNGGKAEAGSRVVSGDTILVVDDAILIGGTAQENSVALFSSSAVRLADKLLADYLIHSTDHFLAINKPPGLAVQGGSKIALSVNDALRCLGNRGLDLRLVHRLDKETSGILLIAKSYLAAYHLTKAFQERLIEKKYIAITVGKPEQDVGEISSLISKTKGIAFEKVNADSQGGKLAVTKYRCLKTTQGLSLIEFLPLTGRMHQIRFHAQQLGCPILGDKKYGSALSPVSAPCLLLHAQEMLLPATIFGEEIELKAPPSKYFAEYLTLFFNE